MANLEKIWRVFKPYWIFMSMYFVIIFCAFYYVGYSGRFWGIRWDIYDPTMTDLDKLLVVSEMIIHGNIYRATNTLWHEAPLSFTLLVSIIALYLATVSYKVDKLKIKNHPISYFNNVFLIFAIYKAIELFVK